MGLEPTLFQKITTVVLILEAGLILSSHASEPASWIPPTCSAVNNAPASGKRCPDFQFHHWIRFNYRCYHFSTQSNDQPGAQHFCKQSFGRLAVIRDEEAQNFICSEVSKRNHSYWIGLRRRQNGWTWVDGPELSGGSFANWMPGGPSADEQLQCVEVLGGKHAGLWNSTDCRSRAPYICEAPTLGNLDNTTEADILDIRLVGSPRSSLGRIEIQLVPNVSETVCSHGFDANPSKVVCRMLGYSDNATEPAVRHNQQLWESDGPMLLLGVCRGDETSLLQCAPKPRDAPLLPHFSGRCDHSQSVIVDCLPPYGPLHVAVTGTHFHSQDSQQVNLTCTASDFRSYLNPDRLTFFWSVDCTCQVPRPVSSVCTFPVTREYDGKNVTCRAVNADNTLQLSTTVSYILQLAYGPERVLLTESSNALNVTLTCTAVEFSPHVTFTWNEDVDNNTEDSNSSTYSFSAGRGEGQVIKCTASNTQLKELSKTASYTLRRPVIDSLTVSDGSGGPAVVNKPLIFNCTVLGSPEPSVRVFRGSENVTDKRLDRSYTAGQGVVFKYKVTDNASCEDAATYSCAASNLYGQNETKAQLHVNCKPQLTECNATHCLGDEEHPFTARGNGPQDFSFDLMAYPTPSLRNIEFIEDGKASNASLPADLTTRLVCQQSEEIIYHARCVFTTDGFPEGLYAATFVNGFGGATVYLQVDPRLQGSSDLSAGPLAMTVFGSFVLVGVVGAAIALGVKGVKKLMALKLYANLQADQMAQMQAFYSRLAEALEGENAAEIMEEIYNLIDDTDIEPDPDAAVWPPGKRLSCASLKPRLHPLPLPPIPTEDPQRVTSRRRWSLPGDYLHPTVCRRPSARASDASSHSCESVPFNYIYPPSLPGTYIHPTCSAADRRPLSLPQDYLFPLAPPTAASKNSRFLSSDYLHPAVTTSATPLVTPKDTSPPPYVSHAQLMANLSDIGPHDVFENNRIDYNPHAPLLASPSDDDPHGMFVADRSDFLPEDREHAVLSLGNGGADG